MLRPVHAYAHGMFRLLQPADNTWRRYVPVLAVALFAVVLMIRLAPQVQDAHENADGAAGSDFKIAVYGPNVLVSEGRNPWDADNSVPRFGDAPASPILPSSYTLHPLLTRLGYPNSLTAFIILSALVVAFGTRSICRSIGLGFYTSLVIALIVSLSTTERYNIALGQTGAALIAAMAFFAVRHAPVRRWWHVAEQFLHGATILVFFAKPTFALAFLAADLAYSRTMRTFVRAAAVVIAVGGLHLLWMAHDTGVGLGGLVRSIRVSADFLLTQPLQRLSGDRTDLLNLLTQSTVVDVLALAVCAAALVWLNRLRSTTLFERLLLGTTMLTALTYHHIYDTLPLVTLLLACILLWPWPSATAVAAGLVITGQVRTFGFLSRRIQDLIGIDWFALQARLVFFVCVGVTALALLQIRRRDAPVTADQQTTETLPMLLRSSWSRRRSREVPNV